MKRRQPNSVNSMLRTVVTEGTASRIRWKYNVYNDLAGKPAPPNPMPMDGSCLIHPTWLWVPGWALMIPESVSAIRNWAGANTALPITGYFLREINALPRLRQWTNSRFNPFLRCWKKIDCDLYELSDSLQLKIMRTLASRDSILRCGHGCGGALKHFSTLYLKQKLQRTTTLRFAAGD